jgi:glycosyltransferase involved in cell wall biosynthesis
VSKKEELPFFYIMLPTFNRAELVLRSVQSIIDQSYLNYKMVIFNDGSTQDYTKLESLIEGNDRIQYIKSHNIGINKSRNLMLDSFILNSNRDNDYFFTLSDDDYMANCQSLQIMANEIMKIDTIWYCFNCESNSQEIFKNSHYLQYEKLKYSNFIKYYQGDKHFVFKLTAFHKIRYPEKHFKNGFEHLFYHKIPTEIQTIPAVVKIIQYYEDGLSLNRIEKQYGELERLIKEVRSAPLQYIFYKKLFVYILKPKNILKEIISEEKYYQMKNKLGFRQKTK